VNFGRLHLVKLRTQAESRLTGNVFCFCDRRRPCHVGFVASLNHPGGNLTGVSFLINDLAPKQLELLRELIPKAKMIGGW
jgi:hypothetical protein